ncbi:UDP-galactose/UDP-glucose transporter 7 isoform X2 [Rhododendron vialii]|uniref:UDP-galactose/UDP-glucose transporter 7 isoform X2 n=1 Tax=Rhododendron vialii TaxID=182163 RepID=UPI00265E55AC|nr:UDP-galactose/UDP-glucose transporter 7 isoform X2 [Rhododendron vialii]
MDSRVYSNTNMAPYLSLFAALSYGVASMAMVFINKAVLMQYAYSMTLLTFQQGVTTLLIHCGRVMGYTKAKGINFATAKKLILVSLFYNANVAFALASLKGVNIPMYIAIKRLTPLAVLVAGFFSGKGRPSKQVTLSVILTAAGVVVAALGDFSFDLVGYSMAFTSVFFQSTLSFSVIVILSLVMGIVLNYTMFLCTIVNSALTTTIVGVLKGVGSTTLGFFMLGGVEVHALNVTGLAINTAGGVWYSYAKYQQKQNKPKLISDVESHGR